MSKDFVIYGQTIFDFCVWKYGTLQEIIRLVADNNLKFDSEVFQGQELEFNTDFGNEDIKDFYEVNSIIPESNNYVKNEEEIANYIFEDDKNYVFENLSPSLISVLYRNGIVTNAIEGEIAVFDFEANINLDTPITFTIDWGAEIGTTIINTTLENGAWKPLQTSIEIPEGVDENQTINVTDTLGGSYQVEYTIEGGYPAIIEDGNTVAWYIADDLTTITKDASDFVSLWADKLGSGNDLIQDENWPLWVENEGILFDGINQYLRGVFTYDQPAQMYIVFKQITWTEFERIFNGAINGSPRLFQDNVSPNMTMYGGINSPIIPDLPLNTFGVSRVLLDSVNSSVQINEATPITGNFGTNSMGGFVLAARSDGTAPHAHIQVKEVILRKITDTTQNEQDIYDYLAAKYSI